MENLQELCGKLFLFNGGAIMPAATSKTWKFTKNLRKNDFVYDGCYYSVDKWKEKDRKTADNVFKTVFVYVERDNSCDK